MITSAKLKYEHGADDLPACHLGVGEIASGYDRLFSFMHPLSDDYPGIKGWYFHKVLPGLTNGTRLILPIERHGEIVGIGIGKKDWTEKKICTIRVAPSYIGRGLGLRIMDKLLYWLDTDKPHLTVSDRKIEMFYRIFEKYNFNLTSRHIGVYVPGRIEFGYNEVINKNDDNNQSRASPVCELRRIG